MPLYLFAALGYDTYRKPNTGMWRALEAKLLAIRPGVTIDLSGSYFVGDAAGRRAADSGKQTVSHGAGKDFSDSDRKFALNLELAFHTPQEFFLGEAAKDFELSFDPTTYASKAGEPRCAFERLHKLEVIVLVGSPAAGKSTFVEKFLSPMGYDRVNREYVHHCRARNGTDTKH